jgi:hypothetical protein
MSVAGLTRENHLVALQGVTPPSLAHLLYLHANASPV